MTKETNQAKAELLKPSEAAKMLHVVPRTLQRMEARGDIKAFRLPSGHRRYSLESIKAIIEKRAA